MLTSTDIGLAFAQIIAIGLTSFYLYWFFSISKKIDLQYQSRSEGDLWYVNRVFHSKVLGGLVMGVMPFILLFFINKGLLSEISFGLSFQKETFLTGLWFILGFAVIWIPLAYINSKKTEHLKSYPQIKTKNWNKKALSKAISGWFIYLIGYELLFRSFLFFTLIDLVGVEIAFAINVALYSTTHLPKGFSETIGAAIVGSFFCYLAYTTQMIWPVLIIHWIMSISNLLFSLKHHPEINYQKSI
jgi:membrane protease YdiL (CAAX protease family)